MNHQTYSSANHAARIVKYIHNKNTNTANGHDMSVKATVTDPTHWTHV